MRVTAATCRSSLGGVCTPATEREPLQELDGLIARIDGAAQADRLVVLIQTSTGSLEQLHPRSGAAAEADGSGAWVPGRRFPRPLVRWEYGQGRLVAVELAGAPPRAIEAAAAERGRIADPIAYLRELQNASRSASTSTPMHVK